jgi:expansin
MIRLAPMGEAVRRRAAVAGAGLLMFVALSPARADADDASCAGYVSVSTAQATWYSVVAPECSLPVAPGDFVTAVATQDFQGSAACGRCLEVAGPLGSVLVRIVDECLSCPAGNLDLGADAFAQIADLGDGIAAISYRSTECPVAGPIHVYFSAQSDPDYAQVQIRNHRYGIASVEAYSGAAWVDLPRSLDNYFEFDRGIPVPDPIDLRITDIHGDVLDEPGLSFLPGIEIAGTHQFAACPEPAAATGATAAIATAAACRRMRAAARR